MLTLIFATGVFCAGVGVAVLWSNPRRLAHQAFAVLSLVVGAWFTCIVGAIHRGQLFAQNGTTSPVPWLRANAFLMMLLAWAIWFLTEAISDPSAPKVKRRALYVLAGLCPFLALNLTDWYIPATSTPQTELRGPGYYIYLVLGFIFHPWLVIRTARQIHACSGLRRVEALFLSFNLAVTSLVVITVAAMGNWLHLPWLRRSSCAVFFVGFVIAAWAITHHRVFNARQILLSLGQRVALVVLAGLGVTVGWELLSAALPRPTDFLLSLGLCGAGTFWLDRKCRLWLRLGNEQAIAELREATIALARTEPHAERLVAGFEELLGRRCGAKFATLLLDWEEIRLPDRIVLCRRGPAYTTLCEIGWVTPESIERRRVTDGTAELRQLLADQALGLIVTAPRGSPSPTLLVALGSPVSGWPFTFPEIQCVQNTAELMDNILTRSRLTSQAAMRAKIEHLAMMSRGLAHDLRNLITPISTYLVHTETKCERGSVEQEVHIAAKRSVGIMIDYVREAAFFANRLTPRFEPLALTDVFSTAQQIAAPGAAQRGIAIETDAGKLSLIADRVLLQRLLVNLLNNAIDASEAGDTIALCGRAVAPNIVHVEVSDQGCGIAPVNLPRVFEPYFTTKEFGEGSRGFGLGLSICQKIAHVHGGTIVVVSNIGIGTTFTIELPARPPVDRETPIDPTLTTA